MVGLLMIFHDNAVYGVAIVVVVASATNNG
jgi:hypothetical protein